jgi:hypothetical protein
MPRSWQRELQSHGEHWKAADEHKGGSTVSHLSLGEFNEQYRPNLGAEVSFFSPVYRDAAGNSRSVSISVSVENGDVMGIIEVVKEDGGIMERCEDGTFIFIPWPCAAVHIRKL